MRSGLRCVFIWIVSNAALANASLPPVRLGLGPLSSLMAAATRRAALEADFERFRADVAAREAFLRTQRIEMVHAQVAYVEKAPIQLEYVRAEFRGRAERWVRTSEGAETLLAQGWITDVPDALPGAVLARLRGAAPSQVDVSDGARQLSLGRPRGAQGWSGTRSDHVDTSLRRGALCEAGLMQGEMWLSTKLAAWTLRDCVDDERDPDLRTFVFTEPDSDGVVGAHFLATRPSKKHLVTRSLWIRIPASRLEEATSGASIDRAARFGHCSLVWDCAVLAAREQDGWTLPTLAARGSSRTWLAYAPAGEVQSSRFDVCAVPAELGGAAVSICDAALSAPDRARSK